MRTRSDNSEIDHWSDKVDNTQVMQACEGKNHLAHIANYIAENPGAHNKDIGSAFSKSDQTVSKNVTELKERGVISDEYDGRKKEWTLEGEFLDDREETTAETPPEPPTLNSEVVVFTLALPFFFTVSLWSWHLFIDTIGQPLMTMVTLLSGWVLGGTVLAIALIYVNHG